MLALKANLLMKRNIEALLRLRGYHQKDLAQYCRRGESWLSKNLKEDKRKIPIEYYDRIADFLGVGTYVLFQPGISKDLERRKTADRRLGRDRRLARAAGAPSGPLDLTNAEIGLVARLRAVSLRDHEEFLKLVDEVYRLPLKDAGASSGSSAGGRGSIVDTAGRSPRRRKTAAVPPTKRTAGPT